MNAFTVAVHTCAIWKELTDWHNLLQGALGSLVGSAIGVLGAFWAAASTIKGQLESDRALARDSVSSGAARAALGRTLAVESALLKIASATQFKPTVVPDSWPELAAANMAMLDARQVLDAELPPYLVDELNELDRRTFALFEYFVLGESIPEDWGRDGTNRESLDPVARAAMFGHDAAVAAKSKLRDFLADPVSARAAAEAPPNQRRRRRGSKDSH